MADEEMTPETGEDDGYGTLDELTALEAVGDEAPGGEEQASDTTAAPAEESSQAEEGSAEPVPEPAAKPEPWQVAIEAMQQQSMEFQQRMLEGFKEIIVSARPQEPEKPAVPVDRYESMARQALGEHAPPEMLRDVADRYKRMAAYEAHEGTEAAKAPEFQRAAQATKQDLERTESYARALAEARAERQALEKRLEDMEQRPVREATQQLRKQDVRAFLLADHDLYRGENDLASRLFPKLAERVRASGAWEPVSEVLLEGLETVSDKGEFLSRVRERGTRIESMLASLMAEKKQDEPEPEPATKRRKPPALNGKDGRTPAAPPDDDDSYGSIRDLM